MSESSPDELSRVPTHNEVRVSDAIGPVIDVVSRSVSNSRVVHETVGPVNDQVHRTVTHIEIKKDWRFLALLAFLILVPPPVAAILGLLGIAWAAAGVVLSWLIAAGTVWVGYRALAKETTVDRA